MGLSYETALDLINESTPPRVGTDSRAGGAAGGDAGPGGPQSQLDPFGFRAAVIDRARLAVADVRPEPAPAWWLPALAVALALLLISGLNLGGAPTRAGSGGIGAPPPGSSVVPIDDREDAVDDADLLAPQEEAPGRAQEPSSQENQAEGDDDSGRNTPAPAEGAGDGAPMSRFLDSLRERPPESGGAGQPGQEQAGQGAPNTQPQGQGQGGAGRDGEPERVEMPSDAGGQSGDDGQAAAAGDEDGQEGGDSVAVASQTGEDGEDAQGEQEGGESNGQAPGERREAGDQPTEGGGDGEQGFEAGGDADGDGSDDPAGEGAAGQGGGPESAAGVADGQADRPEFLRGVLEDGPESPAGAVRLPGQTDVTLPLGGSSPAEYAAAAEEALSEGDLPLSYQEIIRRYFR